MCKDGFVKAGRSLDSGRDGSAQRFPGTESKAGWPSHKRRAVLDDQTGKLGMAFDERLKKLAFNRDTQSATADVLENGGCQCRTAAASAQCLRHLSGLIHGTIRSPASRYR
jgi:hypothetical protein